MAKLFAPRDMMMEMYMYIFCMCMTFVHPYPICSPFMKKSTVPQR